jgi:pilus assembly protein CpaE
MNARVEIQQESRMDMFVFAQTNSEALGWLRRALTSLGPVESATLDSRELMEQATHLLPSAVFIEFSDQATARASSLVAALREANYAPQIIAVGRASDRNSTLAALRAGVQQFIDLDADADEAVAITKQVLVRNTETVRQRGKVLALLGARAGMGVSALAANLVVRMRERGMSEDEQVALLDFGMPLADSMLYLDIKSGFHLVDAVRNLRRLDRTMIQSALTRHPSGVAVLPLPANVADLRDVTHGSAIALIERLRSYFDHQVLDLGGFSNTEFVTQTVKTVDETWLVCDQSAASILSTVDLVRSLRERGVDPKRLHLILGRYDSRIAINGAALEKRVGVPLLGVLPSCPAQMVGALNAGRLLVKEAARSAYAREVERLVNLSMAPEGEGMSVLERLKQMFSSERGRP